MDEIIKTYVFESEKVKLILNIKKELHKGSIKMFIDGDLISQNNDLIVDKSTNISSNNFALKYKNSLVFWMSSNDWKGMRWKNYNNESRIAIYRNLDEMKEKYISQREFITQISTYFYECIKTYKHNKILFETSINEIISDSE